MHKTNYYDYVQEKIWMAHCKAEALRYFFDNFQNNGSAPRDQEAINGIAHIMEEISNDARIAHDLLADVDRPPLETKVEDPHFYGGDYPKVKFKELEGKRGSKREAEKH